MHDHWPQGKYMDCTMYKGSVSMYTDIGILEKHSYKWSQFHKKRVHVTLFNLFKTPKQNQDYDIHRLNEWIIFVETKYSLNLITKIPPPQKKKNNQNNNNMLNTSQLCALHNVCTLTVLTKFLIWVEWVPTVFTAWAADQFHMFLSFPTIYCQIKSQ